MKLFGIFALAAVAVADLDYDSLGLKKPNKPAADKVSPSYCKQLLDWWAHLGTTWMQRSSIVRFCWQIKIVEMQVTKSRQQESTFDQEMQTQVQKG